MKKVRQAKGTGRAAVQVEDVRLLLEVLRPIAVSAEVQDAMRRVEAAVEAAEKFEAKATRGGAR